MLREREGSSSKGKELQIDDVLQPRVPTAVVPRRVVDPVISTNPDVQAVYEEHAEYEALLREVGACTVSETLAQIDGLYARVEECRRTYGSRSWQFNDLVDQIRSMTKWYRCIPRRRPDVSRFLKSVPVACFSSSPPRLTGEPASTVASSSRIRRIGQQMPRAQQPPRVQQSPRIQQLPRARQPSRVQQPRRSSSSRPSGRGRGYFSMRMLDGVLKSPGGSSGGH